MKKLLMYSLSTMLLIVSCTKSENPKLPALAAVPPPLFTMAASSDATISSQNPDSFTGKFAVSLYYPTGAKPKKYDIVVEKNGDPASVKTIQANVTSYPSTITVTGVQLRTLYNKTIITGDAFTFGANITATDGTVYPAFPTLGVQFPAADFAAPGFNPNITFSAICVFTATDYGAIGVATPYTVVQDDWEDYAPGSTIPVTVIDATHLSFFYGTDTNPKPVIIQVNPDNSVTVAKQGIGGYSSSASYGTFFVQSNAGPTSQVFPCALTVSVNLSFTVAAGSFGSFTMVLKKK